jgi:L-2-amino-thiazoline-4-carboxylic acid hydrolase
MEATEAWLNVSFGGTDKLSLLELVKIQAQVLVPVVRAFREELGAERANAIVSKALRDWSRGVFRAIGEQLTGSPREKWEALNAAFMPKIGGDVDMENLKQTPEAWDMNVIGCRYADFFRQLGEPELGALLLCEVDFHVIDEVGGPDVTLERTQTIMKGAKYCDFRWSMKRSEEK